MSARSFGALVFLVLVVVVALWVVGFFGHGLGLVVAHAVGDVLKLCGFVVLVPVLLILRLASRRCRVTCPRCRLRCALPKGHVGAHYHGGRAPTSWSSGGDEP